MTVDPQKAESLPLRILFLIANPSDLPHFDDARVWDEISEALNGLQSQGSISFERIADTTEDGLRRALAKAPWNVLHFVVHAHGETLAHYGAVALQRADGRVRSLPAAPLAQVIALGDSIQLIVLQSCDEESHPETVAEGLLADRVRAVAVLPAAHGKTGRDLIAKFYGGLLSGLSGEDLSRAVSVASPTGSMRSIKILSRDPSEPIYAAGLVKVMPVEEPPMIPPPSPRKVPFPRRRSHLARRPHLARKNWKEIVDRKRLARDFDVFLCHNSVDKPVVREIGESLMKAGILPWLDAWELPPGHPWQPLLEAEIEKIRAAAVFVGPAGFGPWQQQELRAFLAEFVKREVPVIPVLLPGILSAPDLPVFLRQMGWVDFRIKDPDPLYSLIWGITGKKPDDT